MPVEGTLSFAGDKSISHRALMLAAIADGESTIQNLSTGEDVESTRQCLVACGINSDRQGNTVRITGGGFTDPSKTLDCGNSGTTVRLLMGLLAGQGVSARFSGDDSLSKRPMRRIIDPLSQMGAQLRSSAGSLPVELMAADLNGIEYELPVASAQVKSAVLLAGLGAEGATTIVEPLPTRDHTELMLASLGARVAREDSLTTVDRLEKPLNNFTATIPGDPSTAAFFAAAAAGLPGSKLRLENILLNERRIGFFRALEKMGAAIHYMPQGQVLGEQVGMVTVEFGKLKSIKLTAEDVPAMVDELPLLAVIATQARGETEVRGAAELRVKECDRITAICENLSAMGAEIDELDDGFRIAGPTILKSTSIKTYGDHRIAMAFTIAGLFADRPVELDEPECMAISAPEFPDQLQAVLK